MALTLGNLDVGSVVGDMHEHGRKDNYLNDRIVGFELDHVQQFSIHGSSAFAQFITDLVVRVTGKARLYNNKALVLLEETHDGNLLCAYSYDLVHAGFVIFRPIRPEVSLADSHAAIAASADPQS